MRILIRGMEMPKSCIACLLNFGEKRPEYGLTICCPYSDGVISWHDKAFDNGRLASCGIVHVSPHGRLIDVDAEIGVNVTIMPGGRCRVDLIAPTVIEAEEGEA